MFSYSCNGTNIFILWKMKCTIQLSLASLNGTFHLSPHENICTIKLINIHYLYTNHIHQSFIFILFIQFSHPPKLYSDTFWTLWIFNKHQAHFSKHFTSCTSVNILQAAHPTLCENYYTDTCVTLNTRTAPVAFAPRRILHMLFSISLVLEQTSEDCIGNTEHSNINARDECNSNGTDKSF